MKVLLVKMSSLGDVVHTLPAVADAAARGARFDWVLEENYQPVAASAAGVDRVLPVAFRRWRSAPANAWPAARTFLRRLRQRRYDMVIDAQGLIKSAVVARCADGAERVGLDAGSVRERPAVLAYDRCIHVPRFEHAITRSRRLFAAALRYDLPSTEPVFGLDTQLASSNSVVLVHGTTWDTKLWPEAFWISVARRIAEAGLTPTLPWLGGERERAARIAAAVPAAKVCPPIDINGALELVASARGVVGVDSGLAHLGAAFGRPTVMVFGPTDPRRTGGRGRLVRNLAARLACSPCQSRRCHYRGAATTWRGQQVGPPCLAAVQPDRVWSALAQMMRLAQVG